MKKLSLSRLLALKDYGCICIVVRAYIFYPTCQFDVRGLLSRIPSCNTLIWIQIKLVPVE